MIACRLLEPALHVPETEHIAVHKLDMVLADTPIGTTATVRAFNHLLGECGITFFAARKLAPRYRRRFLESLRDAPLLLPATTPTCAAR
jgi:LysR family transcriptional activator of nhaA